MAFVKAVIEIKKASIGTGLKISLRKTKAAAAKLNLVVSAGVAKTFDWNDGDRLEVMLGEGEHHGLMRLRKNNSNGQAVVAKRATAKGEWCVVSLGHQPSFVDRTESAAWCQWERVEDGWIEIVLPKWADETAPRKPAREQSAAPAAAVPPARRAASVTGSLMGDPPPGRREMLAEIDKATRVSVADKRSRA